VVEGLNRELTVILADHRHADVLGLVDKLAVVVAFAMGVPEACDFIFLGQVFLLQSERHRASTGVARLQQGVGPFIDATGLAPAPQHVIDWPLIERSVIRADDPQRRVVVDVHRLGVIVPCSARAFAMNSFVINFLCTISLPVEFSSRKHPFS
jgi:hypothetical protein